MNVFVKKTGPELIVASPLRNHVPMIAVEMDNVIPPQETAFAQQTILELIVHWLDVLISVEILEFVISILEYVYVMQDTPVPIAQ